MERASAVYGEADIAAGTITAVRVRGASVLESEGGLRLRAPRAS